MDQQTSEPTLTSSQDIREIRHGFEVGSYALMVSDLTRAEVLQKPTICAIPSTPEWFAGVLNHRGETVPVYDLSLYLRVVDEEMPDMNWVLLMGEHPDSAGILLTAPPESMTNPELSAAMVTEALPDVIATATNRVYQHQQKEWLEVDHRRLFMALKKQF